MAVQTRGQGVCIRLNPIDSSLKRHKQPLETYTNGAEDKARLGAAKSKIPRHFVLGWEGG